MITKEKILISQLQKENQQLKSAVSKLYAELKKIQHSLNKPQPIKRSKKDELLFELNKLKQKSNKSKQDKENIYTLEMVIKNMK